MSLWFLCIKVANTSDKDNDIQLSIVAIGSRLSECDH